MKEYPLEVRVGETGHGDPFYFTKGHHAISAFLLAVKQYMATKEGVDDFDPTDNLACCRQLWWREVPLRRNWGYDAKWIKAEPHTRGAYPITIYHP